MMRHRKVKLGWALVAFIAANALFITACNPDPNIEAINKSFDFYVPQGWPQPYYTFENNTWSKEGYMLGKKLFFDARLSSDNSTSCGSCHQQFSGFAQIEHPLSHGVQNLLGTRNSQPIFNMAWHNTFFWDGAVNNIERQPINPFENPVEMNMPMAEVVKRVQSFSEYKPMFEATFGSNEINSQKILKTLALFMVRIISDDSKYDKISRGEAGVSYNDEEIKGKAVFETHCATCHKPPLFTDLSFRNNGLPPDVAVNDSGRYKVSFNISDLYKFKVPSLRNLDYTSPYMHDGRLNTLDQVLNHYEKGVLQSATTDPLLANGIQLNTDERKQLLAFLKTLNDATLLKEKIYDPGF